MAYAPLLFLNFNSTRWLSTLPAEQQTLRELRLETNGISDVGAKSLLTAVARCSSLVDVRVDGNRGVTPATISKLASACDANREQVRSLFSDAYF